MLLLAIQNCLTITGTKITQSETSKNLALLVIKQIIRAINPVMAEFEFVIGTERFNIVGKRPQIVAFMVSTNRHLGFVTSNCFRRATHHIEFRAFNVELDIINTRQVFSRNVSIEVNEFCRQRTVRVFATSGSSRTIRRLTFLIA